MMKMILILIVVGVVACVAVLILKNMGLF
jgi:FtsZ-interacting cell division protein ZipA